MDNMPNTSFGNFQMVDLSTDVKSTAPVKTASFAPAASDMSIAENDSDTEAEIAFAENFINRSYLNSLKSYNTVRIPDVERSFDYLQFFRVEKIVYDTKEDSREKLVGVYNSLSRFLQSVVMLICGTEEGVEIYFGIRSKQNTALAGDILSGTMEAYFPGSKINRLDDDIKKSMLMGMTDTNGRFATPNVAIMNIVPSLRENGKEGFTQGLEKFIDTMRGNRYVCQFIVSPLTSAETQQRKRGLEELYTALYPYSKRTLSHSDAGGVTLTAGLTETISSSISKGVSMSTGITKTTANTKSSGFNGGFSVFMGLHFGKNTGSAYTESEGITETTSHDEHTTEQQGQSKTRSESQSKTVTEGTTIEIQNKNVADLLERLEKQIKRMEDGSSYGMWEGAAYFISGSAKTCAMAAGAYKALVAGETTGVEQYHVNYFSSDIDTLASRNILDSLRYCAHPLFEIDADVPTASDMIISPTSYLNGKELSLFLGLPKKSVVGISVIEMAEFGRNIFRNRQPKGKLVPLGKIYHMNSDKENTPANLDVESLSSHCFVTGSTGSGKSQTVYKLLDNLLQKDVNVPFLVIEPAKGEYRREFSGVKDLNVFTANPFTEQFLKINPFYFHPNIHILEHLDRLIEIFNACWEMYAAMPALLKDALEKCYVRKGWDLTNSVFRGETPEYPNFKDLLNELPVVINQSGYSADTKGDYRGALITRVSSLTNGIYGQIFCDLVDIDDAALFDSNTIIDLSRIGSSETKSLIMGFLVLRLSEYRMATAKGADSRLRHVTVLEEAHNLLKNTSSGGANTIIAKSVEMITNCIAEMRTYGEGFIIVDQSPTAVDIAAVKNTNTKIIMRLPEKSDCELCGRAISLNDSQIAELSKLGTGVAAVMQNDWAEAVLCKVEMAHHDISEDDNTVPVKQLMNFKGTVAASLIDNILGKTDIDETKVLEDIERFDIHPIKKREMERYISSLCTQLRANPKNRKKRVSQSIMKILGFEDSFFAAEPIIKINSDKDYDKESVNLWKTKLKESLKGYIDADHVHFDHILQCLIYSLQNEQREIDYDYLYKKIYVR